MFVGIDFPDRFENDNFSIRRSIGNWYDPESLISGEEIKQGMSYTNSKRFWMDEQQYLDAVEGLLTVDEILMLAPRKLKENNGSHME
jgi:hypothetical protein